MRTREILTFAAIMLAAVVSGCSNGNKQDMHTDTSEVVFSRQGGVYDEEFELELTSKGAIYYTTDGSDPSESDTSIKYDGEIKVADRSGDANIVSAVSPTLFCTNFSDYSKDDGLICRIDAPSDDAVDKCTVIRAAAKDSAGNWSAVTTQTYFIGSTTDHIDGIDAGCKASGSDLAVISITMDYDDLFDSGKGIYVKGDVFDSALKKFIGNKNWIKADDTRKLDANYSQRGREWEREAHIDFFEMNENGAEQVLNQDCGIRIQGNYSRSDLQKGFRLYARKDYGDNKFRYDIWGDELKDKDGNTIDKFKTFVLRAGGNCAFTSKYNDTYWQTLAAGVDCSTKASRPCVVYLNGEYWGLYVLEEDYSDDYFESHYGVNKDDVIVYKGDAETYSIGYKLDEGTLPDGEKTDYYFKELKDFFKTHKSLKDDADYEEFAQIVDVDSVMDYFGVEVWINNKWDWPGKNWSMWKTNTTDESNEYADGRWRFCLYDIEFGGVSGAGDAYTNTVKEDNYKPSGLLDFDTKNPAVLCFAYLMTNDKFRAAYCEKLAGFSDTIFEKNKALDTLDKFEAVYGPLFDQFYDRYPGSGSKEEAINGNYASSQCIRDFINLRADNISKITDWINSRF